VDTVYPDFVGLSKTFCRDVAKARRTVLQPSPAQDLSQHGAQSVGVVLRCLKKFKNNVLRRPVYASLMVTLLRGRMLKILMPSHCSVRHLKSEQGSAAPLRRVFGSSCSCFVAPDTGRTAFVCGAQSSNDRASVVWDHMSCAQLL